MKGTKGGLEKPHLVILGIPCGTLSGNLGLGWIARGAQMPSTSFVLQANFESKHKMLPSSFPVNSRPTFDNSLQFDYSATINFFLYILKYFLKKLKIKKIFN